MNKKLSIIKHGESRKDTYCMLIQSPSASYISYICPYLFLSFHVCLFSYICVYIYIQNFPCLCLSSYIMFLTFHICQHLRASVSFLLSARPSVLRLMTMCLCADARMHVKLASASSPRLSMRASSCSCQRLL